MAYSTIDFELKALKGETETSPWISIEKPNKELQRLINAEEVILPFPNVTLIIDYPLTNSATFNLISKSNGFSRKQLIQEISDKYHLIYKEEEKTSKLEVTPPEKREKLLNRNETAGKYGIWGHDISDLDLVSIQVYKNSSGKIYLLLEVES